MKYHVLTYGCQMNVYDSGVIEDLLSEAGHEPAPAPEDAELLLINTCSIRFSAESRIHGQLTRLLPLKRRGQLRYLGVCGCMAQNHEQALLERHPHVDLVLGTGAIRQLPELVARLQRGEGPLVACELDRTRHEEETDWPHAFTTPPRMLTLPVFVSVQRGCNYNCTFCVVPNVRGPERYRPVDEVLAEVSRLESWGAGEITLIGQTVNAYEWRGVDFASLLSRVAQSTSCRVRFATSHPEVFSDRLIDAMARYNNLVEYVHLPAQSGSNRILKRMARRYTRETYLDIVRRIRAALSGGPEGVTVATDLIVGFPGETEEDFEQTLDLLDQAGWESLFSFKYSNRPGTAAARFDNQVPDEVAGRRLATLQQRHMEHARDVFRRFLGQTVEVIVESVDGTHCKGRCRTHHIVVFEAAPGSCRVGELRRVLVEEAQPFTLRGSLAASSGQTGGTDDACCYSCTRGG